VASLQRDGDVFVLDLGEGDNRFNGDSLDSLEACFEEVEAAAPCALVTTATGKVFSNGLDLEWIGQQGDQALPFVSRVHELLARTLELKVPCVAALQGHTFAAGAMFALAHDRRLMRADRGYFCLPEVDISIPFTPGMSALISARLTPATAHETMVGGRRYGGIEAADCGIVEEAPAEQELLPRAIEWASQQAGKDPGTLRTIKQRLYGPALDALRGPLGF
jgi:Delta3-Delta2-enoyl-CoA isomerase